MAITFARDCIFPQDLEAAAAALDQEIGDRFAELYNQIADIELDIPDADSLVDQGNQILQQLLVTGDGSSNIRTLNDLSTQFGLPSDPATQESNEKLLFHAGVIVIGGVMYASGANSPIAGDANNIEILRRLYFASGRSLEKVEQFLQSKRPIITHSDLDLVSVLTPTNQYEILDVVREALNADYLSLDDIYTRDGVTTVLMRRYLDQGSSLVETKSGFSLTSTDQIVSSVFHFGNINNSSSSIKYFQSLGYTSTDLSAILAGVDLPDLSGNPIQGLIDANKAQASTIISSLDFVSVRYNSLTEANLENIRKKLQSQVDALTEDHKVVLAKNLFEVSVVQQTDVLNKLRQKNSDDDIVYLLEKRPEILGIYFSTPDDALEASQEQSYYATAGSTLISNSYVNTQTTTSYDQPLLISMANDLQFASKMLEAPLSVDAIAKARNYLVSFVGTNPVPEVSTDVVLQGQPSTASGSSLNYQLVDPIASYDLRLKLSAIDKALNELTKLYSENVAKPIARVITIVVNLFEAAMKSIQELVNRTKTSIMPFKNKVDAFTSKYLSLIGSGSVDSSILKCAVNFNIGASTPLFDNLLVLLDQMGAQVAKILTKLASLIQGVIEKLLCLPLSLLNSFITGIESNLPAVCQVPRVNLGAELNSALTNLRNFAQIYNNTFANFNGDLLQYKVLVSSAPNLLNQFNAGASCASSNISKFYNAALLNIRGGALGNPIGAASSTFGNITGTIGGVL